MCTLTRGCLGVEGLTSKQICAQSGDPLRPEFLSLSGQTLLGAGWPIPVSWRRSARTLAGWGGLNLIGVLLFPRWGKWKVASGHRLFCKCHQVLLALCFVLGQCKGFGFAFGAPTDLTEKPLLSSNQQRGKAETLKSICGTAGVVGCCGAVAGASGMSAWGIE